MGSGNSFARGCCVELAVTAGSEHPSPGERHLCSAPPPALGRPCGWAPQRESPAIQQPSHCLPASARAQRGNPGAAVHGVRERSFLPEPCTLGSKHRRRALWTRARGLGGVGRGQVGKQAAPLPSGSPHLPPATRPAAASSVPRTLRGAVSAQLRAMGGGRRAQACLSHPASLLSFSL